MLKEAHVGKIAFPPRHESISWASSLITFSCIVVGTAPTKLGYLFRSGIILTPLLLILFALVSYFNNYLFVKLGCHYQAFTFDQIWIASFGKKTSFIPTFISVSVVILVDMFYTQIMVQSLKDLNVKLFQFNPRFYVFLTDYWLLGFFASVILISPFVFSTSLPFLSQTMKFKFTLIIIFIIIMFTEFILRVQKYGFDPNHEISFFNFDKTLIKVFGSLSTAFLVFPLAWPSIQHVKNATEKDLYKLFMCQVILCFFIYFIMGAISYLTFFKENVGGNVFDYYSHKWLQTTSYVLLCIFYLFTIPLIINPSRYLLLNSFYQLQDIPLSIWYMVGLSIQIIGVALSASNTAFGRILGIILDAFSPFLLCIIPSILSLKTYGKSSKTLYILSILDLILGIILCILLILLNIISF